MNKVYTSYLKDIKKFKNLTVREEHELRKRIVKGDEKAKNELYERHLKYVVSVAKEFSNNPDELVKSISDGNMGLMCAMESFDFSRNVRFMTYAVWWIKNHIRKGDRFEEVVKKPIALNKERITVEFECDDFLSVADNNDVENYEIIKIKTVEEKVSEMMFVLNDREREIINKYYGLSGESESNLSKIGDDLGLTRERVRQIKYNALRKIKMNI